MPDLEAIGAGLILKAIIRVSWRHYQNVHFARSDVVKAFDSVQYDVLCTALLEALSHKSGKFFRFLTHLIRCSRTPVYGGKEWKVTSGIFQGSSISSLFYTIFADFIFRSVFPDHESEFSLISLGDP